MTTRVADAPPSARRIGYVPELDGLRGLAAVFVVAVHLFMIVIPSGTRLPNEIPGTFVFMDLFFVLSGFLITALLMREQSSTGSIRVRGFYARRALRLLPALYVMLLCHFLYALWQGSPSYPADVERSTVTRASLYGLNFQMDSMLTPVARGLTQLWSLGVEEQFYLLWPLAFILLVPSTRSLRLIVPILGTAIVAVMVHRALLWDASMPQTTEWLRLYTHTDTRADSLLVGALLAHLWVRGVVPPRRAIEVAAWIAVPVLTWFLFGVELDDAFPYMGGFTLMAIAWAAVILACVDSTWSGRRILRVPVLLVLGEVSYGIYLWHVPIQFAVVDLGSSWPVAMRIGVSLVVTAIAVTLSWFLVERPFLRWKARLDRRGPAVSVSAPQDVEASVRQPHAEMA